MEEEEEEVLICKIGLVGGPGFEKMRATYKPYPTIFHPHLGGFVVVPTRI